VLAAAECTVVILFQKSTKDPEWAAKKTLTIANKERLAVIAPPSL